MAIMVEEFQESDVIFSDEYDSSSSYGTHKFNFNNRVQLDRNKVRGKKQNSVTLSIPICIPSNISVRTDSDSDDDDDDDDVLPPHLIVARRIEERMAFSIWSGYGRPALKGRELSQVRNSILRMTGFLEA